MCLHTYFQSDSFIKYTREFVCVCVSSTCVDWCLWVRVCAPTATQESSQPKKHANATWIHFECGFQVAPLELVKKATHTHTHTHMCTVRNMKCIEIYGIEDDDNPSGFAISYCLYKLHFIHSKNVRPSPSAALSLFILPSLPTSLSPCLPFSFAVTKRQQFQFHSFATRHRHPVGDLQAVNCVWELVRNLPRAAFALA